MAESADLAAFLKERREAAGMTQQALASEARVSMSWLAKLEQGAIVEPGFFPVLAVLRAEMDLAGEHATSTGHVVNGQRGVHWLCRDCDWADTHNAPEPPHCDTLSA